METPWIKLAAIILAIILLVVLTMVIIYYFGSDGALPSLFSDLFDTTLKSAS